MHSLASKLLVVIAVVISTLILSRVGVAAEAVPVELKKTEQGWQLLRDGEPYFIRGAGGTASLRLLADAGANSVRTWGADNIDELLDEAHALGLTVAVGIWLGHERHGFDYSDPAQVAEQLSRARDVVLRHKDHPAVLLWGVGNEMEGFEAGDNPAIWAAVNDVAAMIRELDPAHPTMTVTAEIGGGRVAAVNKYGSAIDIHGINSYAGASSLPERYREAGGSKPYIVTEFGPPGAWEVAKSPWGAAIEPTSTQKAESYRRSYQDALINASGLALGGYAFNWGFKMEGTATWFGMFLPDGSSLAAVDAMTGLWSGASPQNLAPVVQPLAIDGQPEVDPGQEVRVRADVSDPEEGPLDVRWALRRESNEFVTGGDFRPMLPDIDGAIIEGRVDGARVNMPLEPGPYRLFLYVRDDAGKAATANLPLLVTGEPRTPMPVGVYQDSFEGMPWAPSGWMGAIDALTLDGHHTDKPHSGSASIRLRVAGGVGWAGVAWQNPPNNWGDLEGGFDLRGARFLELWARGEYGGERIKIGVGLLGDDTRHPDSGITSVDGIVLTRDWQRYRIPLGKIDLSSIKTGFVVTLSRRPTAATVYLDDIRYVR